MTIKVTDTLVIGADETPTFVDETAYKLRGAEAVLDNFGSISVTLHSNVRTSDAIEAAHGEIRNEAGASFTLIGATSGEDATGVRGNLDAFVNDGDWIVNAKGVAAGARLTGAGFSFDNEGQFHVSGLAQAIGFESLDGGAFVNGGVIRVGSRDGAAIGVHFGDVNPDSGFSFSNTGKIIAIGDPNSPATSAINVGVEPGATYEFDNSGLIRSNGFAFVNLSPDLVSVMLDNTGKMVGQVDLGLGDDTYDGARGQLKGELDGGAGDDVLHAGKGGSFIHGDSGVSGDLDGDDLITGGAGTNQMFGDGGDDTLVAGTGGDAMTGGDGIDTFLFGSLKAVEFPTDTITDLENTDVIDLSGIDAATTQAGDQAFHIVANFTGHAGELVFFFQPIDPPNTLVELDVDGDGQADATIVLNGSHTDFTNFVL